MKIRQVYVCGKDVLCVRFSYNEMGLIAETTKIDINSEFGEDEFSVPSVQVTDAFFYKAINNPKLND